MTPKIKEPLFQTPWDILEICDQIVGCQNDLGALWALIVGGG